MKSLPPYSEGPQWNKKLIEDLAYIKKHKRYPLNKRTRTILVLKLIPAVFLVALILWLNVIVPATTHKNLYFTYFLTILYIPTIVSLFRYPKTLKFINIPTPFFSYENQQIIEKFLEIQNLIIYRHPNAPDVFQIVSKSMNNRKDIREVMIFIADDKQILINSHFTTSGFSLMPATRHYEIMGKKLKEWLTIYNPNNDPDIVFTNKF
ncbi:MAG TPA: hypothetical protein VN721_04245 [Flavipsychrobacter sp.]|nr:hypothetical protein [Flavipsychrobacter sp.]